MIDHMLPAAALAGARTRGWPKASMTSSHAHIAVKMKIVEVVSKYAEGESRAGHGPICRARRRRSPTRSTGSRPTSRLASTAAAENLRLKIALDVAATNVMVADASLNIAYTNDSLKEMLARAEGRHPQGSSGLQRTFGDRHQH